MSPLVNDGCRGVAVKREATLADHAPVLASLCAVAWHVDLHVLDQILFAVLKHTPDMIRGAPPGHAPRLVEADVKRRHYTISAGAGHAAGIVG